MTLELMSPERTPVHLGVGELQVETASGARLRTEMDTEGRLIVVGASSEPLKIL